MWLKAAICAICLIHVSGKSSFLFLITISFVAGICVRRTLRYGSLKTNEHISYNLDTMVSYTNKTAIVSL